MAEIARKTGYSKHDMQILCAIRGEHRVTPACEDSGKAAYAIDLCPDRTRPKRVSG